MIAPLTANTLAKLAHGLADDVLTEAALAHRGPVLVAPAMNTRMWEHEATQANAATLRARGVELIGPEAGELAEGEVGAGRMSEPEAIAHRIAELLGVEHQVRSRAHSVLVSAGGTREPVDAVRFLGNRSSGRMGVALAARGASPGREGDAARREPRRARARRGRGRAGADRRRPRARGQEPLRRGRRSRDGGCCRRLPARPSRSRGSVRKTEEVWKLELEPTTDVLGLLGEQERNGQVLVGFGAELGEAGLERKRRMLTDKNLDLVVYNDVSTSGIGFDAPDNEVTLVTKGGERQLAKASKDEIAAGIVDEVERLLEERRGGA